MNYNEFKTKLTHDLAHTLHNEFEITFNPIYKVNEYYDAMTISKENMGVNLNLNRLYKMYLNENYEHIYQNALKTIKEGFRNKPNLDTIKLSDYQTIKEKLFIEIISIEKNLQLLNNIPYTRIEDMAIIYRIQLSSDNERRASLLITNQMLRNYHIDQETLHKNAISNAPIINPMIIEDLHDILFGILNEDIPITHKIYVASIKQKSYGACILAYPGFMEQASLKAGGDFFILPSSIHEILIVPDNGKMHVEDLQNMVKEVNMNEVDYIDQLTDSVYHYDHQAKIFELGETYIQRIITS